MRHYLVCFVGLLALTLAGGCRSSQTAPVAKLEGNVTIGGKPLPADAEGSLAFVPAARGEAPPAKALLVGGHYKADNVPVGSVQVTFDITRKTGKMLMSPNDPVHQSPELINLVPEAARSGMQIEVKGNNSQQNFDLK